MAGLPRLVGRRRLGGSRNGGKQEGSGKAHE
jgi:hypothetical protein